MMFLAKVRYLDFHDEDRTEYELRYAENHVDVMSNIMKDYVDCTDEKSNEDSILSIEIVPMVDESVVTINKEWYEHLKDQTIGKESNPESDEQEGEE